MTAILIVAVLCIWGAALFAAGYFLTFWIKKKWIRVVIGVAVTAGLFTLPVRDEIKGQEEFEALCKAGGIYEISPNAAGKKLDLIYSSTEFRRLTGYTRPIEESTITYTDVATGETVASAKAYLAKGGWLVRHGWLKNSGGGDGALWGRPQCFPPASAQEQARLRDITYKVMN